MILYRIPLPHILSYEVLDMFLHGSLPITFFYSRIVGCGPNTRLVYLTLSHVSIYEPSGIVLHTCFVHHMSFCYLYWELAYTRVF